MDAIMAEPLITEDQLAQLLANDLRNFAGENIDPKPVVKLFTPDAAVTWLITEADPADSDHLFNLCNLGLGQPELGYISLAEIRSLHGRLGLPVERDLYFMAQYPLSWYAKQAGLRPPRWSTTSSSGRRRRRRSTSQ